MPCSTPPVTRRSSPPSKAKSSAQSRKSAKNAKKMDENEIATQIIDAAFKIHQKLGPGLLESVYETILAFELERRGLQVQRQLPVALEYESLVFESAFRIDLLANEKVIVEVKALEELAPVHRRQLLTYLRLRQLKLGLLINFGSAIFKQGIVRMVNGLPE
jgi:GxxExxY protein